MMLSPETAEVAVVRRLLRWDLDSRILYLGVHEMRTLGDKAENPEKGFERVPEGKNGADSIDNPFRSSMGPMGHPIPEAAYEVRREFKYKRKGPIQIDFEVLERSEKIRWVVV